MAIVGCHDQISINNTDDLRTGLSKTSLSSITIDGKVWNDLNKNGIRNHNEPGIKELPVGLFDCGEKYIDLTHTDENGNYSFKNIPAGEYKIKFQTPEGFIFTRADKYNDSKDSDVIDPISDGPKGSKEGFTACITLNNGQLNLTFDAGVHKLKTVRPRSYGYWKTHSKYGPASYDVTWALIGEDTPFFYSAQSWFRVINNAPRKGNLYYILAHEYIAARLNMLAGANLASEIEEALSNATLLFDNPEHTPQAIEKLRWNDQLRKEFLRLSYLLGKFNYGVSNLGLYGGH
jgi:hypothetical protein